ncbi:MAG: glycosyltransferase family 4 protein [Candidatus Parvarchaeota archaeon]|nr:glycosyltransferase family 4 protein [Candidatus Parvarchaeota archaeon]MCW1295499.1 glycosyltransferase family 4 protein [Candidatus Parvarchaeum tengchongense]MCW1299275.1 glycosyltransferase family 4 protein [Candidatus Parvarchaeum tengchongense]MCW1311965.1 glycosyltransferase family 4 protein [Candidatus Parvarchaeum tengchongense]
MKVLFLGWEFPPHSVGGLGTHSYNIVKALSEKGVIVNVILPFKEHSEIKGVKFLTFESELFESVYDLSTKKEINEMGEKTLYRDVFNEVEEYKNKALELSSQVEFDVIHANDWVTGRAAIEIKKRTGKKLVATIHSTEYDRTAGKPWERIAKEEKELIDNADVVVTVSRRLKEEITALYNADERKVSVIYNAINREKFNGIKRDSNRKVVLYVGRLSVQKGIDNLIRAFKIVSKKNDDALLYIIGEGPELSNLINLSINLDLSDKVIFLGRVPDAEMEMLYSIANVFVMPSVSEPFGIVALEAIASNVPTIVSSQSGVSEIIKNTLTVDFWDTEQMADLILGLLDYSEINKEMSKNAYKELDSITWEKAAEKFIETYNK